MDKKLGIKTLYWIYDIFSDYFINGDIVIAGSFYYKRLGCNVTTAYKDVDLVVDKKKDIVFHEILDYIEREYNPTGSFRNKFDDELIGSFHVNGFAPVDVLRNNFINLRPKIEIIPGVKSYCLSDKVLYETYKMLEEKTKDLKYKTLKEFFYARTISSI